ncbi:dTDP-4-amino-4,6-dideoxygalactose transaminase [Algoriphagus sp. PAP.12]|uniref:dTDP-4-amino-4,6-dideoxygalactose transaminase n=1 Tax=Algoriphagus sp. PAP.12 TaxID=2996678 RepID=UPI002DD443AB|nr:dTDP-4-amino-4,6-dideoxygalactose transaminase [Algoriphagus sp. PAP.12]
MKLKIPFNKPFQTGLELSYIEDAIQRGHLSGNGYYTQKCQQYLQGKYQFGTCFLTSSCTDALEMSAILLDIQQGDEVIVPSFTFVSTANAFALRGAKIVFVDSRKDHPNMDEDKLEDLISSRTKAIVAVHYGGFPCDMVKILALADQYNLIVIEDAAQAIDIFYQNRPIGSWGHLACFSFHETKNIQCGEGGMLVVNDSEFAKRAEVIWEKGTNRSSFSKGEVSKYTWVDLGSSFLPSELNSAYLWAQLECLGKIQERRRAIWLAYSNYFHSGSLEDSILPYSYLENFKSEEFKAMSSIHQANSHLFYLLFENEEQRKLYIQKLEKKEIMAVFHYQSLHKSDFSKRYFPDQYRRELPHADRFSESLLRLPLFYELPELLEN